MRFTRRLLSNIFLILLGMSPLFAQKKELESGYYHFVDYQKNQITLGDTNSLQYFFKRLDTLCRDQDTKVNIVHIGDSHIQADFFSNKLRELFQSEPYFGNGGRGYLFPFDLAKTNNPPFYSCRYSGKWEGARNSISHDHGTWGLSGVSAKTEDSSATFRINLNARKESLIKYQANTVRVYYPIEDSTNYAVRLKLNDSIVYPDRTIHNEYVQFSLAEAQEEFDFLLERTDSIQSHFEIQGLYFGNDEPGIVYHSIGVNGAKVDSYLRCQELSEHLETLNADLVIMSLGTNDAYNYNFYPDHYRSAYKQLIREIRKAAPKASLLLTGPGDNMRRRWRTNPNNAKASEVVLELADEFNCAAWNFYEVMGGLKSINNWVGYGLGKRDFLHLSGNGYYLQGQMLYDALILDQYFGKSQNILVK